LINIQDLEILFEKDYLLIGNGIGPRVLKHSEKLSNSKPS
jgi:hypothetical protein